MKVQCLDIPCLKQHRFSARIWNPHSFNRLAACSILDKGGIAVLAQTGLASNSTTYDWHVHAASDQ
jgi:hypothetical protein